MRISKQHLLLFLSLSSLLESNESEKERVCASGSKRQNSQAMALRQLATGAGDGCSADDGASASGSGGAPGPSNPLGGLADALLGRPSKAHERAHEVRG